MSSMNSYRNMVLGKATPISAKPQPLHIPGVVAGASKGVVLARTLLALAPWAVPGAAAGLWMAYPAMGEESRRMFIPGYALLYPAPKETQE